MIYWAACKNFPIFISPCRIPAPAAEIVLFDRLFLVGLAFTLLHPVTSGKLLESLLHKETKGEDCRLVIKTGLCLGRLTTDRCFFTPITGFVSFLCFPIGVFERLRNIRGINVGLTLGDGLWLITFGYSHRALLSLLNSKIALSKIGAEI